MALAVLGAAMASVGDVGQLWVVNAARPELQLAPLPPAAIVWATLLGTFGIPLYGLGYCARALRAPDSAGRFVLTAAGAAFGALGGAVHATTGALVAANVNGMAGGLAPLQGVLHSGAVSMSLWAAAGVAFLVASATALRLATSWKERALNPLVLTLLLSGAAPFLDPPLPDFVGPAAVNLAHLLFFLSLKRKRLSAENKVGDWRTCRLNLGTHVLSLRLPERESRVFPRSPVVERIDAADRNTYGSRDEFEILEKYWDDPAARHAMGAGTLRLSVSLRPAPDEVLRDATDLVPLERLLDQRLRAGQRQWLETCAAKGIQDPDYPLPEQFGRTTLSGRAWITYTFPDKPGISVYVAPLGTTAYLRLQMTISVSHQRPEWLTDATALQSEILSQLDLTESSDGMLPVAAARQAQVGQGEWRQQILHLSGQTLSLALPSGESTATPTKPLVETFDLGTLTTFGAGSTKYLLDKHWDCQPDPDGAATGTLNLIAVVSAADHFYSADLRELSDFVHYLDRHLWHVFVEEPKRKPRRSRSRPVLCPPRAYKIVDFNDRQWVSYPIEGTFDATIFSSALGERHHLSLLFRFLDQSKGSCRDWRETNAGFLDRVMRSVRITSP